MELEGTVYAILPAVNGTSAKGNWTRQDMVIEFKSGDFNRKLSLTFWGDKTSQIANLSVGEKVKAHFDLESREFNGKWFTTAQAWRVDRNINVQQTQSAPNIEEIGSSSDYEDEIPF